MLDHLQRLEHTQLLRLQGEGPAAPPQQILHPLTAFATRDLPGGRGCLLKGHALRVAQELDHVSERPTAATPVDHLVWLSVGPHAEAVGAVAPGTGTCPLASVGRGHARKSAGDLREDLIGRTSPHRRPPPPRPVGRLRVQRTPETHRATRASSPPPTPVGSWPTATCATRSPPASAGRATGRPRLYRWRAAHRWSTR